MSRLILLIAAIVCPFNGPLNGDDKTVPSALAASANDVDKLVNRLRLDCFQRSQLQRHLLPLYSIEKQLIEFGTASTSKLIDSLKNPRIQDEFFAQRVIHVLGEIGDPGAVNVLVDNLSPDLNWATADIAYSALEKLDKSCANELMKSLEDKRHPRQVRIKLGRLMAKHDLKLATKPLLALVKEKQYWGAAVLAEHDVQAAAAPLLSALQDQNYYAGISGLGRLKYRRAVPTLITLLQDEIPYDIHLHVGASIITALGEIGDPRAVGPLLQELESNLKAKMLYVSPPPRTRTVIALGKIGDRRAFEPIQQLTTGVETIEMLKALARIDPIRSVPSIVKANGGGVDASKPAPPTAGDGAPGPDTFLPDCIQLLATICENNIDPLTLYFDDRVAEHLIMPACVESKDPDKAAKLRKFLRPEHPMMFAAFDAVCREGDLDSVGEVVRAIPAVSRNHSLEVLFAGDNANFHQRVVERVVDLLDPDAEDGTAQVAYVRTIVASKHDSGCAALSKLFRDHLDEPKHRLCTSYVAAMHLFPDQRFLPDLLLALDHGVPLVHVSSILIAAKEDPDVRRRLRRYALAASQQHSGYFALETLRQMRDPGTFPVLQVNDDLLYNLTYVRGLYGEFRTKDAITVMMDIFPKWPVSTTEGLKYLDASDFDALLELAQDPAPLRRQLALRYLCEIGVPQKAQQVFPVLRKRLGDEDIDTQIEAAAALCSFDLTESLNADERQQVQHIIDETVSRIPAFAESRYVVPLVRSGTYAIHAIIRNLPKYPIYNQRRLIGILRAIGDPRALDALYGLAGNEEAQIGWAAIEAIAAIGDRSAIPFLIEQRRQSAAKGLGAMGNPGADALLDLLNESKGEFRKVAVHALAFNKRSNAEQGQRIMELIPNEEDPYVRKMLAYCLARTGLPGSVDLLIESLASENYHSVRAAENGLLKFDPKDVLGKLQARLKQTEDETFKQNLISMLDQVQRQH